MYFENTDISSKEQPHIIYNYYETTLRPNQYEKTFEQNGYIKLPYVHSKSILEPNLIIGNDKYKTSNLYIFKNQHNSRGCVQKPYDAELIVEHTSVTNYVNNKVYTCFLLKGIPTIQESNSIDNVIMSSFSRNKDLYSEIHIDLNELIIPFSKNAQPKNILCFANQDNTVFIFKQLVVISSNIDFLTKHIPSNVFSSVPILFSYDTNKYGEMMAIPANPVEIKSHKVIEGLDGAQELDCIPITDTNSDNKNDYILSQTSSNKNPDAERNQSTLFAIVIAFILLLLGIGIGPTAYSVILNLVHLNIKVPNDTGIISIVDTFLILFFIIISVTFIGVGVQDSSELLQAGVYLIIFTVGVFGGVLFNRFNNGQLGLKYNFGEFKNRLLWSMINSKVILGFGYTIALSLYIVLTVLYLNLEKQSLKDITITIPVIVIFLLGLYMAGMATPPP